MVVPGTGMFVISETDVESGILLVNFNYHYREKWSLYQFLFLKPTLTIFISYLVPQIIKHQRPLP